MNLYELASRVIEAMEAEHIPYMVVGADQAPRFPAHSGGRDRQLGPMGRQGGLRQLDGGARWRAD